MVAIGEPLATVSMNLNLWVLQQPAWFTRQAPHPSNAVDASKQIR